MLKGRTSYIRDPSSIYVMQENRNINKYIHIKLILNKISEETHRTKGMEDKKINTPSIFP